ncbi:TPA: hypothetical protein HIQ84_001868 [Escherichia coli]|nr:hypothetical protein [Escherichia coli]HAH8847007.1 hypothetical protein [Escherichia coli]
MSKSLYARCIRRWEVRTKNWCDSKFSLVWRKRDKKFFRNTALVTADCMVETMAESNARVDFGINGWSPEFSAWYDERRAQYHKEALDFLNEEATTDEIDEQIEDELEAWND